MSVLLGPVLLSFFLSSCNLYGGLSSPSNDEQYLIAARACFDRGDYQCSQDNYAALSSNYNDAKVSENSLSLLAQANIFSISDLVRSLGTNLGSPASFAILAETLAGRNIIDGAHRTTIKKAYDDDSKINDGHLKAFSKFLAALAMFNELLANAVGPDGKLTVTDIVTSASLSNCKSTLGALGSCVAPAGTTLGDVPGDNGLSLATAGTDWSGPASTQKLITTVIELATEFGFFSGSNQNDGLIVYLKQIQTLAGGGASDSINRYAIITALNLQ